MSWAQLIAGGVISVLAALGTNLLFIGPMRRKYGAEARSTDADVQVKLVGPALVMYEKSELRATAADMKAERAEARAEHCQTQISALREFVGGPLRDHIELLEDRLRARGETDIPPMPTMPLPLPFPRT